MASAVVLVMCLMATAGIRSAEGMRRHHRHRRDPDPVVGEERGQKPNLYKPKFEDCKDYDPTVPEGSRKGKLATYLNFAIISWVTQPRGSFFCCTTVSRVKTSATPKITLEMVTWNRVPESAAHSQLIFGVKLFSPKTCLVLNCTQRRHFI